MKIYLYINDGGDGSYSISYFKSAEDRQKQADYDEDAMGYVPEGATDYEIDTDNIKFDEPQEIELEFVPEEEDE